MDEETQDLITKLDQDLAELRRRRKWMENDHHHSSAFRTQAVERMDKDIAKMQVELERLKKEAQS